METSPQPHLNSTKAAPNTPKEPEPTSLFVGGLSPRSTEHSIRAYFERFGPLEEVNLIIDWVSGESKCCAIVIFQRGTSGKQALRKKRHAIDRTRVRVSIADDKKKGTKIVKTTKLYVGNLPPRTSETELIEYFGQFGRVKTATISENKFFPESVTHGFLEFQEMSVATKVLDQRHNLSIRGEKITCSPYRAKEVLERSIKAEGDIQELLIQEMAKMITNQMEPSKMEETLYNMQK